MLPRPAPERDPGPAPAAGPEADEAAAAELGARGRAVAAVLWCSFLAASVATMVTFALVDPAPISDALPWAGAGASRTAVYSLGFFYFWAVCAAASALTAFMLQAPVAAAPSTFRDRVVDPAAGRERS